MMSKRARLPSNYVVNLWYNGDFVVFVFTRHFVVYNNILCYCTVELAGSIIHISRVSIVTEVVLL